jgi:hypothetical protein
MKYLLILFCLSSVLACDINTFDDALDNLQYEEVDRHMPNLGLVPTCLKQFIDDYRANYNYGYALRRFKNEKTIDNTYSCYDMTNPNQSLGDKIEKAFDSSNQKGTWSDPNKSTQQDED